MELEGLAVKWANRCEYKHPNPYEFPDYGYYGQNIAVVSGTRASWTSLANAWHSEINKYNFDTNSCSGVCGHFKQVCMVFISDGKERTFAIRPNNFIHEKIIGLEYSKFHKGVLAFLTF